MNEPKIILTEAPREQIVELAQNVSQVYLALRRKNNKGSMAHLAGLTVSPGDLTDGTLERILSEMHGGGEYMVHALNVDNHMEELLPRYYTSVDGAPRLPTDREPSPREQRINRMFQPAPVHAAPGYVAPGSPYLAPSPLQSQGLHPRDLASRTSDEIASEQVMVLRDELQQIKASFADQQQQAERRIEKLRADNEHLRLQQRDRDAAHERELQNTRFRDLEAKLANPAKPALDVAAIATLLGALVPVFTAMVNAGKDRAALMVSQQTEASKLQMEGIKTMVTMQAKKPDFDLKEIVALATPLVTAFISGRDPAKMADLMTAMGENQLGLLSMVANLVNNMGGDETSPMVRILQEAVAGAVNVAEKMAAGREQAARQQQAPRQLQAVQPAPAPAPTSRRRVGPAAPPAAAAMPTAPPTPDQLARMLLADPGWPPAMRSPKWHALMRDVHDDAVPVEDAARAVGKALDALHDAGLLPAPLAPIFEGEDEELLGLVQSFFGSLPVAENAERMQGLVEVFYGMLRDNPVEDDAPPHDATNGMDSDAVDTPSDDDDDDGVVRPKIALV